MSVTVTGDDALVSSLHAAGDALGDLTGAHTAAAARVVDAAQGLVPVRTGYLRASIWGAGTSEGATVAASAPYAGYVHARTPFLSRALTQAQDAVLGVYETDVAAVVNTIHGK